MDLAIPPHTLLLPIDPGLWPPPSGPVRVDDTVYAPKRELHVTLIGSRLGSELNATFATAFLHEEITRAMAAREWRFERTGRLVELAYPSCTAGITNCQAPSRRSVIELIDLPAMRGFHQTLGALLGRQLPVPPPHVTLYTAHDPGGIGLASPWQLRTRRLRALRPEAMQPPG